MAVIEVNHNKIEKAANNVDAYITKHKNRMDNIGDKITELGESWNGKDYSQAKEAWRDIKANDSTSGKMLKDLENYSKLLRFSAQKYKKAQIDAVNRAQRILL